VKFDAVHFKCFGYNPSQRSTNKVWRTVMKLSAEQLRQFDDLGYLHFPNCFSEG
jgi:hypothetical protein